MTPNRYVAMVVLPTVQEYLGDPSDSRKAYLAAIATYHITDYLMRAAGHAIRRKQIEETKKIEAAMKARHFAEFEIIEGMCHGTKHSGRDTGHRFAPGNEIHIERFTLEPVGDTGIHEFRHGEQSIWMEHNGSMHTLHDCLKTVLRDFKAEYPQHFGTISFNF